MLTNLTKITGWLGCFPSVPSAIDARHCATWLMWTKLHIWWKSRGFVGGQLTKFWALRKTSPMTCTKRSASAVPQIYVHGTGQMTLPPEMLLKRLRGSDQNKTCIPQLQPPKRISWPVLAPRPSCFNLSATRTDIQRIGPFLSVGLLSYQMVIQVTHINNIKKKSLMN